MGAEALRDENYEREDGIVEEKGFEPGEGVYFLV